MLVAHRIRDTIPIRTVIKRMANSSFYDYTGRENDGNRLCYYRARYYSPESN
jgi:hypothetical protein